MAENVKTIKRVLIAGNAVILTSNLKTDDIKKLNKYAEKTLCLIDPETKDEIFRITTGSTGSVNKYGITFSETNAEGNAQITIMLPDNITNKKEYVKETYFDIMNKLTQLENNAIKANKNINTILETFANTIEEV